MSERITRKPVDYSVGYDLSKAVLDPMLKARDNTFRDTVKNALVTVIGPMTVAERWALFSNIDPEIDRFCANKLVLEGTASGVSSRIVNEAASWGFPANVVLLEIVSVLGGLELSETVDDLLNTVMIDQEKI